MAFTWTPFTRLVVEERRVGKQGRRKTLEMRKLRGGEVNLQRQQGVVGIERKVCNVSVSISISLEVCYNKYVCYRNGYTTHKTVDTHIDVVYS